MYGREIQVAMLLESIDWEQDFLRVLNIAVESKAKQRVVTLHLLNTERQTVSMTRMTLSIRVTLYIPLEIQPATQKLPYAS